MVSTRVRFLLSLAVVTLFGLEPGALQGLRVNAPLIPDGDVSPFFALSPDSRFTVFVADGDRDEVHELYSVRLGPPFERIRLNDEFLRATRSRVYPPPSRSARTPAASSSWPTPTSTTSTSSTAFRSTARRAP
jgi:hypothetical protein